MQRTYTLDELAKFLKRQPKELKRLAENGQIVGRKSQGEWIFAFADVARWMERELTLIDNDSNDSNKVGMEIAVASVAEEDENVAFCDLLSPNAITLGFPARTRSSVLSEISKLAENAGLLWDAGQMAQELAEREEMESTALENGVAILHPRRPAPNLIAQDFLAVAIARSGVPFGGPRGTLSDVFFLLCCRTDVCYLRSLSRLSRALKTPGVLEQLREAENVDEVYDLLIEAEGALD